MFSFLFKKAAGIGDKHRQEKADKQKKPTEDNPQKEDRISAKLDSNLQAFKQAVGESGDVKVRTFCLSDRQRTRCALLFIDGLVNAKLLEEGVLAPLLLAGSTLYANRDDSPYNVQEIRNVMLYAEDVEETQNWSKVLSACFSGDTVLLVDCLETGLIIASRGWDKRGISEPQTEAVVRGPREGFTETLRVNTSLLRRKIKTPNLRFESMVVGEQTNTDICLAYLEGIARPEIVEEIRKRIQKIDMGSVLESSYIEHCIEDTPWTIFPTIAYSEKPDVVAAQILEGRVAVLVDGSPFVLTAPMLLVEAFQSAEDYYTRPLYVSLVRLLRYLAFFIGAFAPAIYAALTTFHQELIPTTLLFTMAEAREGTPFPAFVEAGIMLLAFEILREAGLRLPRPVGQSISIVGALIMGEAAVSAGVVGAPMVITMAISAVCTFIVPQLSETISVARLALLILGGTMGGFGVALGFLGILIHLSGLTSIGVPYFGPIAPMDVSEMGDSIIRLPLWMQKFRPALIAGKNRVRQRTPMPDYTASPPEDMK